MKDALLIFDLGNVILRHDNDFLIERIIAESSSPEEARKIEDYFARSGSSAGRVTTEKFFTDARETLGLSIGFSKFETLWCSHFSHDAAMEDFVTALAGKYRLVVLSNTNDSHWRFLMREYDIMQVPHALYTSFELGMEKPALEIYRHVLETEGCKPEEAIFIDDKSENVEAAKALGIHGIHFTGVEALKAGLLTMGVMI